MSKLEKIFDYLNKNKHKNKILLIDEIREAYDLTPYTAKSYYYKWKTYRKRNGLDAEIKILLRPLDLKKSNLSVGLSEELKKCTEEDKEFQKGALAGDINNTIEEFWDSVQTKLNVMGMIGIEAERIYKDLEKHIKKMNNRGYIFKLK